MISNRLVVVLCLIMSSCASTSIESVPINPLSHLPTVEQNVLQQVFTAAGGFDAWQNLDTLSFIKNTILYDADGTVESNILQDHLYIYKPKKQINISWSEDETNFEILEDHQGARKLENNQEVQEDTDKLVNQILSTTYVVHLPFKLADTSMNVTYLGQDSISGLGKMEVLQATPRNPKDESFDIWWHYYEPSTWNQEGYRVKHLDHYSQVINLESTVYRSLRQTTHRKSYRVDSLGKQLYLRAEYHYQFID